jgi:hypothetical protein
MFKGLVSLRELVIQGFKNLRVIEYGAFKHLSNTLEDLNLWDNSIETIDLGTFKCLSKLNNLDLRDNQLTNEQLAYFKTNGELPPTASIR